MRPPRSPRTLGLALALLSLTTSAPAQANTQPQAGFLSGIPASRLCRPAIELAERRHGIPARLLHAIGRVESGRADPATGQVNPWPWTVNAEGQGFYFDTKAQAIAAVTAMRERGVRSMDVGCMQVNLLHHPDAFAGLEQAFDPLANADYAARFLRRLFDQTGTWPKATAWYHSATPELGEAYQKRVNAVWPEEQKLPPTSPLATAWGATMRGGAFVSRSLGERPTGAEPAAGSAPGRTLESYRATPITWVFRPAPGTAPATPAAAARPVGPATQPAAPRPLFPAAVPPPAQTSSAAPAMGRSGVHFLR